MFIAEIGHGEAEVLVLGKELNADWLPYQPSSRNWS